MNSEISASVVDIDVDKEEENLFEWAVTEALFRLPDRMAPTAWAGHIPFLFLLTKIDRPRTYVELGVFNGASFMAACTAAREYHTDTLCYGIDTWQGDIHAGQYEGEAILQELTKTLASIYPPARLLRGTFDSQLHKFNERSIDILHIDGLHTYDAVQHDFETWLPKMSDRGIILFHDISVREREFGVWLLWEQLREKYPSMEFYHSFGLGVLFVGSKLTPATTRLLGLWNRNPTFREFFRCVCENVGGLVPDRFQARVNEGSLRYLQTVEERATHFEARALTSEARVAERDGKIAQLEWHAAELTESISRLRSLEAQIDHLKQVNKKLILHRLKSEHQNKYNRSRAFDIVRSSQMHGELLKHKNIISESGLFSRDYYLDNNPDVRQSGIDPLIHFVKHGYYEGRRPNPIFDTAWYAAEYEGYLGNCTNPLVHYVENWRSRKFNPNPYFSVQYYMDKYSDVAASGIEPSYHYMTFGAKELRDTSEAFSTGQYADYQSCIENGRNPLGQFLGSYH